jgi:ESF2/ABP1 family protein
MSDELPIASRKRPFEEQDHAVERDDSAPSNAEAGPSVSPQPSKIKRKKSKANKSVPSPGIVYVSRLPPGMTPQKVKHLMERWGEVGRIYAQKKEREWSTFSENRHDPGAADLEDPYDVQLRSVTNVRSTRRPTIPRRGWNS